MRRRTRDVTWYHGEPARRTRWSDQRWDRDTATASPNEAGPGIYFTDRLSEAEAYGPVVYAAHMRPSFKLMPQVRPSMQKLLTFASYAPEDDLYYFRSNWHDEPLRQILTRYAHQNTLHDALLSLYGDLYRDPYDWVVAVLHLGYDGVLVEREGRTHLVVWNPQKLDLQELE